MTNFVAVVALVAASTQTSAADHELKGIDVGNGAVPLAEKSGLERVIDGINVIRGQRKELEDLDRALKNEPKPKAPSKSQ